ncbi:UbiA prenyltransferase family-domain-containing protein [Xylaria sp. CBS 124048]|nr:UbiA prenyltransferase family-domain-containing protein [Xylaria sp. CBS 124048]
MALNEAVDKKSPKGSRQGIRYHLKTLLLFTKSDVKTVLIPQSVFALALAFSKARSILAPDATVADLVCRIPCMLAWLWLHLLVTAIANQRRPEDVLEDKENKPWRPMPSGRLSTSQARGLLRAAAWVSLGTSLLCGSLAPSISLMVLLWLYNDLGGSSVSPVERNLITTGGLSCFGWGAVSALVGGDISPEGESLLKKWMVLMGAMMATTVQAQDFPDTVGDTARGRRTIPVVYGSTVARLSLVIPAVVWSWVCPAFWHVGVPAWLAPVGIGGWMIGQTLLARWEQRGNERVWRLWCFWQTVMYLMPLFGRFSE